MASLKIHTMGAKRKPWSELQPKQHKIIISELVESIRSHCKSSHEVQLLVNALLPKLGMATSSEEAPADDVKATRLLAALGKIRAGVAQNTYLSTPVASLGQLDDAVKSAGFSTVTLTSAGYNISKRSLRNATSASSSRPQKRGRKSKVFDKEIISACGKVIAEHAQESEKIAVLGRGMSRRMTVVQHLSKTRRRIYKDEVSLHSIMSLSTFRKVMKTHYPHVRKPTRKTDVCEHCRHLERRLLPSAEKAMAKGASEITSIFPSYFEPFDKNPAVVEKKSAPDKFPLMARFVGYVETQNRNPQACPTRMALAVANRLSLHKAEAEVLHVMKAHVELIEAYRWHQISARRQGDSLKKLPASMSKHELLLQMDFKENVRYPLSFPACNTFLPSAAKTSN